MKKIKFLVAIFVLGFSSLSSKELEMVFSAPSNFGEVEQVKILSQVDISKIKKLLNNAELKINNYLKEIDLNYVYKFNFEPMIKKVDEIIEFRFKDKTDITDSKKIIDLVRNNIVFQDTFQEFVYKLLQPVYELIPTKIDFSEQILFKDFKFIVNKENTVRFSNVGYKKVFYLNEELSIIEESNNADVYFGKLKDLNFEKSIVDSVLKKMMKYKYIEKYKFLDGLMVFVNGTNNLNYTGIIDFSYIAHVFNKKLLKSEFSKAVNLKLNFRDWDNSNMRFCKEAEATVSNLVFSKELNEWLNTRELLDYKISKLKPMHELEKKYSKEKVAQILFDKGYELKKDKNYKNDAEAQEYLLIASEVYGHAEASYEFAMSFAFGDEELHERYLRKSADAGYVKAMSQLGQKLIFYGGRGLTGIDTRINKEEKLKKNKKGFEYLEKAAGLGDLKASSSLGMYYSTGVGCEKNYQKSLHYTTKAAQLGEELSIRRLARMYYQGKNIPKNYIEAYAWSYVIGVKKKQIQKGEHQFNNNKYSRMMDYVPLDQREDATKKAEEYLEKYGDNVKLRDYGEMSPL